MNEYKILITGSVGAGKTTAIGMVSDISPVCTDVKNTDVLISKKKTTVGLDFGFIELENGDRILLYGTPGQERFDFLWSILAKNALGIIVLINNLVEDPIADLSKYLDALNSMLSSTSCVIGISHIEEYSELNLDEFSSFLRERELVIPIYGLDPRNRSDVLQLIDSLLMQIEAPVDTVL